MDDSYIVNFLLVFVSVFEYFAVEFFIYFFDYCIYFWKKSFYYINWLFFKCFNYNGMICVGNGFCCDILCFFLWKFFFVN